MASGRAQPVEWKLCTDRWQLEAMLALNKPDSRKVREMSFSHSQLLNADQPPKKRDITRLIAWGAMISGLLSFVLPVIFMFVSNLFPYVRPIEILGMLSGPVAAVAGVALGLLSLIRGWGDPETCQLAVMGVIIGGFWFFVVWMIFYIYF